MSCPTCGARFCLSIIVCGLEARGNPGQGQLLVQDLGSLFTGDGGQLILPAPWPGGIPAGTQLWLQFAIDDDAHPSGTSLSNAVLATQT